MEGKIPMRLRASAVVIHRASLLTVRLEDPATKTQELYLPGGKIERGEEPIAAAIRETKEETGYVVAISSQHQAHERTLTYPFTWAKQEIHCTTHFFLAELADPEAKPLLVCDAPYHKGVVWLPVADCVQAFSYHEGIRREVLALVKLRGHGLR